MTMKKKALILLAAMSVVLATGVTVAFMFRKTEPMTNELEPAQVSCSVEESFDGTNKSSIRVKNDSNVSCYLRLRMVSYWQDKDGNIVGKASEMPAVNYDTGNWFTDAADDYTYYYRPVVESGQSTGEFLQAPIVLKEDVYQGEPVYQVLEIFAEAMQAEPEHIVETYWHDNTGRD